ncbi:ATP-binding protein [Alteromonas halophila]|uniref:histidine kinase n=1 Tax=Alteromonas halophila TaxID=516698 RepID=A0A918MXG1_9ALTE|nr:ATP-binding protein [Alteromonas halophila]GGW81386.1 hypothetical protein GCM10007391_13200 [Alteromonas halophila]
MTRLFFSLYVFITLSLITLTLGLDQLFQPAQPRLTPYQQAWLSLFEANQDNRVLLDRQLRDAGLSYSVLAGRELTTSTTLSSQLERGQLVHGFFDDNWQVYVPVAGQDVFVVRFATPADKAGNWWLVSSLFFILLGVGIALWLYPLWRDLRKLVAATEQLNDDGSLAVPALSSRSPLRAIVRALEKLSTRVTHLLRQQQELAGAVTHEFKTPLARLKFAMADDEGMSAAQTQEARRDIDELDTLVQEMLDFTRMNARQPDLHIECIPLYDFCCDRVQRCLHPVSLKIDVQGDNPELNADAHFLAQALDNLLNNAVRHARRQVVVVVEHTCEAVTVHVDDDGEGVSESQRESVFKPFYRQDTARSRSDGGAGLGLAIVSRIANWLNASCKVTKSPLGGARFSLRFRLSRAQT